MNYFLTLILFSFTLTKHSSCFLKYSNSLWDRFSSNNKFSFNAIGKSNHRTLNRKHVKFRKSFNKVNRNEDLDNLFSKDNNEHRLIKEKNASIRYFSELNNPLMRKIAHSNQIKSGLKIKKLAKRAEKNNAEFLRKIENKIGKDSEKKEDHKTVCGVKNKGSVGDEVSKNVYKRAKLTEKELHMLPLKVPGVRALEPGSSNKLSVEEIDTLIKLGYNGIIDMNSLFTEKIYASNEVPDSHFVNVSFESLGINDENLVKTLVIKGIKKPTNTQDKFIPELTKMMEPKFDLNSGNFKSSIIHASTGSGKTMTYLLPILQSCFNEPLPLFTRGTIYDLESISMYLKQMMNQDIIVICPSLELCVQSCNVAREICEEYQSIKVEKKSNNFYNEFSKILGIPPKEKQEMLEVITEIKPTLLIGNANVMYQKKNIKRINSVKLEDYEEAKRILNEITTLKILSKDPKGGTDRIKRTVAMYFATPGRLHTLLFKHKIMDMNSFKYIVLDEYDSYLEKKANQSKKSIKNQHTKELITRITKNMDNKDDSGDDEEVNKELRKHLLNLRRKYIMCVSASNNIDLMPNVLRNSFGKCEESSGSRGEKHKNGNDTPMTYQLPQNILHTIAIYTVPDAKLSLLRKILKSVPYNKSVLIFCDSNDTGYFLYKYLSSVFNDASINLLNSVQNKLSRRKTFDNLIQTNIDNTNLDHNKRTTRLVKDILISTRLNSRGIDFCGYTHVINYDLPHDSDSYLHKSGRIGRAGNPGICISLVESKNLPVFNRVIVKKLPLQFHHIDTNNGLLVTKP